MKDTFKTYRALVRQTAGEGPLTFSSIVKEDLTAPELALLAMLHGPDGLPPDHIFETGEIEITQAELREDLAVRYRTDNTDGRKLLGDAFGAMGRLPRRAEEAIEGLVAPPPFAGALPNEAKVAALRDAAKPDSRKRTPGIKGRPPGVKNGEGQPRDKEDFIKEGRGKSFSDDVLTLTD